MFHIIIDFRIFWLQVRDVSRFSRNRRRGLAFSAAEYGALVWTKIARRHTHGLDVPIRMRRHSSQPVFSVPQWVIYHSCSLVWDSTTPTGHLPCKATQSYHLAPAWFFFWKALCRLSLRKPCAHSSIKSWKQVVQINSAQEPWVTVWFWDYLGLVLTINYAPYCSQKLYNIVWDILMTIA